MAQQTPGKSHRKGVSVKQLMKTFPNEEAARKWLESDNLAGWSLLSALRQLQRPVRHQA